MKMKKSLILSMVTATVIFTGCNSTNDQTSKDESTDAASAIVQKSSIAVGSTECPTGGVKVTIGFDTDSDGVIDQITQEENVCNGSDGLSMLMETSAIAAGALCVDGGVTLESGLDLNANMILEASEITETQNICFGGLTIPAINSSVPLNAMNYPLGKTIFPNGYLFNASWGVGSAATHKVGDDANTFYSLTDRGVNIKCKDALAITGTEVCGNTSDKIFPFPDFTPSIIKYHIDGDNVVVKEVITLKDRDGKAISGLSNPLSNFSEKAYDKYGAELPLDPNGLDTESIAALSDGTFWVSEEYASSLVHVAADGKILKRLVPAGLEGDLSGATYDIEGSLPAIIAKRHANRGIESIAISPDENYLYFMMQSPLDNPDSSAYSASRNVRLYKMEIANPSNIKEYLYVMDRPDTFNKDNESKTRVQKDVKVSEMITLDTDVLMVLERINTTTKLYRVELSGASEVTQVQSQNLELNATGITSVTKSKVFDTDLEEGYPAKLEGIAHLEADKFLLINDNDFGIFGDDTVAKIATIDVNGTLDKKQTAGRVVFFDTNGTFEKSVSVGILPDMVKFTHDGAKVLVANEGELVGNEDIDAPLYDPFGTISIIDAATYTVTTVDFSSVTEAPAGSKIRKGAEIARDFEPEYIAVSDDNTLAWVSLQESNAIAKIDLTTNTLAAVYGLGFKDLSVSKNGLDYKKDETVTIEITPTGVFGMYQPDTIATYKVDGVNYVVTANEGDDRDDFYGETIKASKLTHTAIGDIGNLRVNPDIGDEDGDGDYEKLYAYGARSFSIFNGDTGALVYDSGSELADKVALDYPTYFNTRPQDGGWKSLDNRSEKKGIEPEALNIAKIGAKVFAYIGLEKQGGFFVYDITDPANPTQVEYNNDINYSASFDPAGTVPTDIDDMAPEGTVSFIQNSKNYFATANEVSGSVSVYELNATTGEAVKQGTYRTGLYDQSSAEIVVYEANKLFVTNAATNSVMILDISDVANISKKDEIDLSDYGTGVNSVTVHSGKLAVAVEIKE